MTAIFLAVGVVSGPIIVQDRSTRYSWSSIQHHSLLWCKSLLEVYNGRETCRESILGGVSADDDPAIDGELRNINIVGDHRVLVADIICEMLDCYVIS